MRRRKHSNARISKPSYRSQPRFKGADRRKKRTMTLTTVIGVMMLVAYIGSVYTNKAPEPKSKYSKAATAQAAAPAVPAKNVSK
jgi:hypothetical protein